MIPKFDIPPQYFYALAASLPPDVSADVRYRLATLADEATILDVLRKAVETGILTENSTVTLEIAARRLHSLGAVQGVRPVCAPGVGLALTTGYAKYKTTPDPNPEPDRDIAPFWNSMMGNAALAKAHLELVLGAALQEGDPRPLIAAVVAQGFALDSVKNLDVDPWPLPPPHPPEITYANWLTVFTAHPDKLPDSVGPGSLEERVGAFVRMLQAFFSVSTGALGPGAVSPGAPESLPRPVTDLIQRFFDAYRAAGHGTWEWGQGYTDADRDSAIATLNLDPDAEAWVAQAVDSLNNIYSFTAVTGIDDRLHFTLAESLYARGFSTRDSISALTESEFTDALIGTPAHEHAHAIFLAGGGDPKKTAGGGAVGPFQPINPGDLVNCEPDCALSPTGNIAYLQGLLGVELDGRSLGYLLTDRTGPLGDLAATAANSEIGIPLIDLVNESLESMVATGADHGAIYDTDPAEAGTHPDTWFGAVPSHSSPAVPVAEPAAYDTLANDFSAPTLPYDQRLDVNRRYLEAMGTTRFDVLRGFRRDITEFVLDRAGEPSSFPKHLWRYPVRLDVALEYLCISPVEYQTLFSDTPSGGSVPVLYGFDSEAVRWKTTAASLPELLNRLGLEYCELVELMVTGYVPGKLYPVPQSVRVALPGRPADTGVTGGLRQPADRGTEGRGTGGGDGGSGTDGSSTEPTPIPFPACEPCCPSDYLLILDGAEGDTPWVKLAIITRLWRKLRCTFAPSFAELAEICTVLGLFDSAGKVNPDFTPQLVALQMLRERFRLSTLELSTLLDLWREPHLPPPDEVVDELIEHISWRAHHKHHSGDRGAEFQKLLRSNLDPMSVLGGFDPTVQTRNWYGRPTHTLRFAEQLAKVYASGFGIGELLYLCTADSHLGGDDPYPLASDIEAEVDPLFDPDNEEEHSLWALRRKLLDVIVDEDTAQSYTWERIADVVRNEIGWDPVGDRLTSLGAHLFPSVVQAAGIVVSPAQRSYTASLSGSTAAIWNSPGTPFRYDDATDELSATVPLDKSVVLTKLSRIRPLQGQEPQAVRNLFAAPRLELAQFGFLFSNLDIAWKHLIAEPEEQARWHWFRERFAVFHARCRVIARHLAEHVLWLDGGDPDDAPDGTITQGEATEQVASRLLKSLLADENFANPLSWENDNGHRPDVTWDAIPVGSAFATLTGLVGTGLLAEHTSAGSPLWREMQATTSLFDAARDSWNAPVPTLIPSLGAVLPAAQQRWAGVRNGIGIGGRGAQVLGGIEAFRSSWSGLLLVEQDGSYSFWGQGAERIGEEGDELDGQHWQVRLNRGQKHWILLSHAWADEPDCFSASGLALRRGMYDLSIELVRDAPGDDELEDAEALRCGLIVEYQGPDTADERTVIPTERLYQAYKDAPLDAGINKKVIDGVPEKLLQAQYVSTLRDVRRTYQRAFKSLLLAYRFGLSAQTFSDYAQSELGYLLEHGDTMAGLAFYETAGWHAHAVDFDPNLLPLRDSYFPPAADDRAAPSKKRRQGWFDVWERLFDHVDLGRNAEPASEDPVWLLYDEAAENQPDNPAQLLRHLGIDLSHAELVLTYDPGTTIEAPALTDERWSTRVWHADQVVRRIVHCFAIADLSEARPDLWAAANLLGSGGNLNLVSLVRSGFVDNGAPRRYKDLRHLDDCLRVHARDALVTYLTRLGRVTLPGTGGGVVTSADQLSDLLLIDVETGTEARTTRIDAAIAAAQSFVARSRLGLEFWRPDAAFIRQWNCRYASCEVWGNWRRSELYRENHARPRELKRARRTEAFRFLEEELHRATLTAPIPGGLEHWNAVTGPPRHPGLLLLQQRDASALTQLAPAREGLGLMGTPELAGSRSWLAPLRQITTGRGDDGRQPTGGNDNPPAPGGFEPRATGALPRTPEGKLPLWTEAAIRLGARFLRVPAAAVPPAGQPFSPREDGEECTCCPGGYHHGAVLDEYYFWLVDSATFDEIQQVADWPGWHNATTASPMLEWPAKGSVHLMWAHVRDGEIRQPRKSFTGVKIPEGASAASTTLTLVGRQRDSLLLRVGGASLTPGAAPPPDPGFRYDMASDQAIVVPQVTPDKVIKPKDNPGMGKISAYPYFLYFDPGAPLFPSDPFAEAVTVACTLRARCGHEAATAWYTTSYDPMLGDNRWCPPGRRTTPHDTGDMGDSTGDNTEGTTGTGTNAGVVVLAEPSGEGDEARPATGRGRRTVAAAGGRRRGTRTDTPSDTPPELPVLAMRSQYQLDRCCDGTGADDATARQRHLTLEYLETLLEWAHCAELERTAAGRIRARLILDGAAKVLGPTPPTTHGCGTPHTPGDVRHPEGSGRDKPSPRSTSTEGRGIVGATEGGEKPGSVATFTPCGAPLNPWLMSLFERVADRRAVLQAEAGDTDNCCCMCGDEHCGCDAGGSCNCGGLGCCCPASPYRFNYVLSRAADFASQVTSFGSEFQSALEKGDAELLTAVRTKHEQQVLNLNRTIRKEQWRDSDWQVQGLRLAKQIAQTRYEYYNWLITRGLVAGEIDYRELSNGSFAATGASSVSEAIGVVMGVIPDVFVGTTAFTQLPLGTKLANVFAGISRISGQVATILSGTAGLRTTEATWDRRLTEWNFQRDVAGLEIAQAERNILAAERRRAAALAELNSSQRQLENSREMVELLRDKTTSHAHFLWLSKEVATLYRQMYEIAECAARQAERAFNIERGFTDRRFVPSHTWNDLHHGLTSGEHLTLAVRRMDAAYTSENVRDYELTKHVSLRKFFGSAFLDLKVNGECTVELPEWLFDLDYPGHYLRRLKSVSLTIPAVVGPYTGVHARLTLLSSTTRIEPRLLGRTSCCCGDATAGPCGCGCGCGGGCGGTCGCSTHCEGDCASCGNECCEDCRSSAGYALECGDCRAVRDFGNRQAIATSTGQNDSGLFELLFRDERYLPFEYAGAVSTWKLEIPLENNDFDLDQLADAVMHINYTAREGGPVLRKAASAYARECLPDAGERLIDLSREMPEEWARFTGEGGYRRLDLRLSRDYFAGVTSGRGATVRKVEIFMESEHAAPSSHVDVEFEAENWARCEPDVEYLFHVVAGSDWCGFYHGEVDAEVGPITSFEPKLVGSFEFEEPVRDTTRVFLLVHYELTDRAPCLTCGGLTSGCGSDHGADQHDHP
ncbi:neuraminidase-like domain-containing protein [Pseudarthrobacter sp. TAF60_1]|uniref:Tc toxin subunit A-related protein n=1 Tax=Pseudarthrobacter sp. TAF60_1 TaxID=3233071 RepID=UPI003F9A2FD7